MFQRVGAVAYKPDLKNTLQLCAALGNPQSQFKSIHVGGTNGKGSSSHLLASVLQEAGYKTGLYTSPHLKDFRERIRINSEMIPEEAVLNFVNKMLASISEIQPSFFELTVAMAFEYFATAQVDVAVIEVGLGGRLDSTNVITPEVALITNIGWDHMDLLGSTLPAIAGEKAGIIKRGIPVVISERQIETDEVFIRKAQEVGAELQFAADYYNASWKMLDGKRVMEVTGKNRDHYDLPLPGNYQLRNVPGVLQVIENLQVKGFKITPEHIQQGFKKVLTTGLRGRWQVLSNQPKVICDTGHNLNGVEWILNQLESETFETLWIIWGMVKDKDVSKILAMLPSKAKYVFSQARIPRALDASKLAAEAFIAGLDGVVIPDVNEALAWVRKQAAPMDLIFIGGSTFLVGEIDEL